MIKTLFLVVIFGLNPPPCWDMFAGWCCNSEIRMDTLVPVVTCNKHFTTGTITIVETGQTIDLIRISPGKFGVKLNSSNVLPGEYHIVGELKSNNDCPNWNLTQTSWYVF